MRSPDPLHEPASGLLEAARAFNRAAETPGGHERVAESLELHQEALQELSAAWYRLAADAVPAAGLSREEEVTLLGALHDVAAAFARCARACRERDAVVAAIVSRGPSGVAR